MKGAIVRAVLTIAVTFAIVITLLWGTPLTSPEALPSIGLFIGLALWSAFNIAVAPPNRERGKK